MSLDAVAAVVAPRELQAQTTDNQRIPYLSKEDRARFQRTDAIIQVETMGYSTSGPYTFVQPIGGAIELIPMARIATEKVVPVNFAFTNGSAAPMVIIPQLTVSTPPGTQNFKVNFSTKPFTLAPRETRVLRATVGTGNVRPGCFGRFGGGTSLAFVGVFGLVGVIIRRRRRVED
jgi:hypothetical protein